MMSQRNPPGIGGMGGSILIIAAEGKYPGGLDSRGESSRDDRWVGGKNCRTLLLNLQTNIKGDGRMGGPGCGLVTNVEQTNRVAMGQKPGQCCRGWWEVKVAKEDATRVGCTVADCVRCTMDEDDGGGHPVWRDEDVTRVCAEELPLCVGGSLSILR